MEFKTSFFNRYNQHAITEPGDDAEFVVTKLDSFNLHCISNCQP